MFFFSQCISSVRKLFLTRLLNIHLIAFAEMAERHNAKEVLQISRSLVHRLQDLIENKWSCDDSPKQVEVRLPTDLMQTSKFDALTWQDVWIIWFSVITNALQFGDIAFEASFYFFLLLVLIFNCIIQSMYIWVCWAFPCNERNIEWYFLYGYYWRYHCLHDAVTRQVVIVYMIQLLDKMSCVLFVTSQTNFSSVTILF